MVEADRLTELRSQVDWIRVGVIDSRRLAYRVLTVLGVSPVTVHDVDELDDACRELVAANPDLCLIENDIDNGEEEY